MSTLFEKSRSTINEHILNAYTKWELLEEITKRKIGFSDFSTKPTNYYNLDVIISVGCSVKYQQEKILHALALKKANQEYEKYKLEQKKIEKLESIKELDRDLKRIKQIANGK